MFNPFKKAAAFFRVPPADELWPDQPDLTSRLNRADGVGTRRRAYTSLSVLTPTEARREHDRLAVLAEPLTSPAARPEDRADDLPYDQELADDYEVLLDEIDALLDGGEGR